MFKWLKNKLRQAYTWLQFIIVQVSGWLHSLVPTKKASSTFAPPDETSKDEEKIDFSSKGEENIDFSSYTIGDQRFFTPSYAKIYDMTAKRMWQWMRNLVFLKKWAEHAEVQDKDQSKILAQFLNETKLALDGTDLSFERNPIPLVSGTASINEEAFKEYLGHLAHHRHYHLFAQVLMCLLKRNSVDTLVLLKNLIHARDQLNQQQFFEKDFTLLYMKDKSQQWIASLMYRIFPKPPKEIKNLINGDLGQQKNYLLCDDICYTGTQAIHLLEEIAENGQPEIITLLFGQMSLYALSMLNKTIEGLRLRNPMLEVNIIVGELFHTLSAQLDFLPFPPTLKERHIIKQLLEADFTERYKEDDFRRKPLVTTAWKKPDYLSSYWKFLGFEKRGPNPFEVSKVLLSKAPSEPIRLFSAENPPPDIRISQSFISGPQPPYKPF